MLVRMLSNQPLILYMILFFASLAVLFLFLRTSRIRDPREPVSIPPSIPVIGHAISLFLYGSNYYEKIRYTTSSREFSGDSAQGL